MRLDRIELYQLHTVDRRVPIEESIGALVDLQREGKIGQIGVSNVSAAELARARTVAEIVSVQNAYNLRDRSSDTLVDLCADAWIAFGKGRSTGGQSFELFGAEPNGGGFYVFVKLFFVSRLRSTCRRRPDGPDKGG